MCRTVQKEQCVILGILSRELDTSVHRVGWVGKCLNLLGVDFDHIYIIKPVSWLCSLGLVCECFECSASHCLLLDVRHISRFCQKYISAHLDDQSMQIRPKKNKKQTCVPSLWTFVLSMVLNKLSAAFSLFVLLDLVSHHS